MKKYKLSDMKGGWFVGAFEPTAYSTDFEVGIHVHTKGEFHQDHFHKLGTEINLVLDGSVSINDTVFNEGDIFILYPYELSIVEYLTDVRICVVRNKSIPSDKYEVDIIK